MSPTTLPTESMVTSRWLASDLDPLNARVVRIAHAEIGVEENEGANNSPRIREYLACVGSPIGSSWCGGFAWWCVKQAGGRIPPVDGGSVQKSREWALRQGLWLNAKDTAAPLPGCVTVYGEPTHAHHCGVLARVSALGLRDIEGNTTWSGYGIDGVCVAMKPVFMQNLLGFIRVVPA